MSKRLTQAMDDLMPAIEAAFSTAIADDEMPLYELIRVLVRESGQSVRLPVPDWPTASQGELAEPAGKPETAFRILRQIELDPLGDAGVKDKIEEFSKSTVTAFFVSILSRINSAADAGNIRAPTEGVLADQAMKLGSPCRVIAGPKPYDRLKNVKSVLLDGGPRLLTDPPPSLSSASPLGADRLLLFSLTSRGPWAELLEPAFILDWKEVGTKVKLSASRRLYLNNVVKKTAVWYEG